MGSKLKEKEVNLSAKRITALEKEISELKQALQNSEARFRLVATSISDAIYVAHITEDGSLAYNFISPNLKPITGYNTDRFAHNPDFWLTYTHPDDRHIIHEQLQTFGNGESNDVEFRWVHGNGRVVWLRNNGRVIQDKSNRLAIYGLISDVTERKKTEKALAEQTLLFENLLVVAQATTGHPNLEQTLSSILNITMMLIGINEKSRSSFFVFDENGVMAASLLSQGKHVFERKRRFIADVIDKGLVGWVVRHRQKALLFDTSEDDRWLRSAEDIDSAQSALAVPIMSGADMLAVLTLTHPDIGYFTMEHSYLLEAASNQIALAVRNAQMHDAQIIQAERQRTLYETLRTVGSHLDPESVAQAAVTVIAEQTHWPVVEIFLPHEDGEHLVVEAATGRGINNRGHLLSRNKGMIGRALRLNKTQYAPDVAQDEDYVPGSTPAKSELVVPLRHAERILGVLNLLSNEINGFDNDEILLAESLAEAVALSLDNARLHRELGQAKEFAEEANKAKSEFVSIVSHELKNPMTSIRGYADLLGSGAVGAVTQQQVDFIKTISTNVSRMQTLVSDLTDVSRIESGHFQMEFGPVSLIEVISEVVRVLQKMFESKEQILTIDPGDNIPPIWGDRNRLVQIMTNLLSNAHKYTHEKGEVMIHMNVVNALPFEAENDDETCPMVQIGVQDTGIGIAEEDQQMMFQKFFRAADRQARLSPGTGLGLNITKNLVELQNGRIWFKSEFRKGTTFFFTVPVAEIG